MTDNKFTDDSIEHTEMSEQKSSDVIAKEMSETVINLEKRPRLTIKPPRTQHPKSDDEKSVDKESLTRRHCT